MSHVKNKKIPFCCNIIHKSNFFVIQPAWKYIHTFTGKKKKKKRMFDSCIHAPLSMLEVINNTAGLNEVSVQHSGWCCYLFVVFILFIEHAHPFLAIRVCTALLLHLPPCKRMNSHSRMTTKFRNVIFPPPQYSTKLNVEQGSTQILYLLYVRCFNVLKLTADI